VASALLAPVAAPPTASSATACCWDSNTNSNDRSLNLGWGLNLGIPVNHSFGFKIGYIGTRTQEETGADTDTLTIACSLQW